MSLVTHNEHLKPEMSDCDLLSNNQIDQIFLFDWEFQLSVIKFLFDWEFQVSVIKFFRTLLMN